MNWVDLVIVLLLVFFAYEGFNKSFIGELLYLLSFIVSYFLSINWYGALAAYLQVNFQVPHSLANVLAFILIWFLAEAIIFPLIYLLIPRIRFLTSLDKALSPLSFLPSLLRGLVFVAILLILVGTFPIQPGIKVAIQDSKSGSIILANTQALEGPLRNVFGDVSDETLTFLTIKPKSDEKVDLGFQTYNYRPNEVLEDKMIGLVNNERKSRGLSELIFDDNLRQIARSYSADMFNRGYFSHYSPEGQTVADRAQSQGIDYLIIGENLAYAPSLNLAHNGLMNSPGHRANILAEDFNKVGIGIMDSGVYGLMITQVFSN